MKVILLQNVAGLGRADDVKEVAEGYARNFLFPKHLAVQASTQALSERDAHRRKLAKESERELKIQETLAEKLEGREVELLEKSNDSGMLYAAVTPLKVSQALDRLGFSVAPEQIKMRPIKEVTTAEVPIKFAHGLEATITVIINSKKTK